MLNRNGHFTNGFLRLCKIIVRQVPVGDVGPAFWIARMCNMVAREIADVFAGIEFLQQALLVWDILCLDKQTAKGNSVTSLVTKPTDADQLECNVSVNDEIADRINVLLAKFKHIPEQSEFAARCIHRANCP